MIRFDHVMIRTRNLELSISFYEDVFGLRVESTEQNSDGDVIAFMKCDESGVKIELNCNQKRKDTDPSIGNIWGHIAFYCDDATRICALAEEEYRCLSELTEVGATSGKKYLIGTIISPEGIEIGVVQKLTNADGTPFVTEPKADQKHIEDLNMRAGVMPEVETLANQILNMMAEKTKSYGGMNNKDLDDPVQNFMCLHYEGVNRKAKRLPTLVSKLAESRMRDAHAMHEYKDTLIDLVGYALLTLVELENKE